MINSVRNTVLAILNKNNYGYLSPSDFNLFAKQAQLDIFEQYFIDYNTQINRENARVSGTEYADIRKGIEEAMEVFFEIKDLTQDTDNKFFLPSLPTTGDDYFMVNKILCYDVDDEDARTFRGEAEKVTHSKITMLVNSNLTQPTKSFPAYSQGYNSVSVYPVSFQDGAVECHYFRYPKDPKWTYTTLGNGTPIFNPSPNDYQDFELPIEDEPKLVAKILQYAGISIRESEVFQFGKIEEGATQPQQQ
jgi:hypothetical protein